MTPKSFYQLLFPLLFFGINAVAQSKEWLAPSSADKLKSAIGNTEQHKEEGRKIFESLCWTCHGLSGMGNGPASFALPVKPADLSDSYTQSQSDGSIYWKISTGRGAMASYIETLTSTQRWQLVQYIRQLKKASNTGMK